MPQPPPEQGTTGFQALLHCSSCNLSFLLTNPTLCTNLAVSRVNQLASGANYLAHEGKNSRHHPATICTMSIA
jgi:hypothetical protein